MMLSLKKRLKITLITIISLVFLLTIVFFIYASDYYRADDLAIAVMKNESAIRVQDNLMILSPATHSEPPGLLPFGDISAGIIDGLLAGNGVDRNHDSRPVLASSSGRYKKFCHTTCMKQPSLKESPFFRLEQKWKP